LTCEDGVTGWQDGFFNIELSAPYTQDMGAVTVRLTNTLDQSAGDESIGYGDMEFTYEYDPEIDWTPTREWPSSSPADYDDGVENPDGLWENDCGATRKECNGMQYYGGFSECARGHSFWRVFEQDNFHPETTGLVFTGRIWTIDSWDGEHFTV